MRRNSICKARPSLSDGFSSLLDQLALSPGECKERFQLKALILRDNSRAPRNTACQVCIVPSAETQHDSGPKRQGAGN